MKSSGKNVSESTSHGETVEMVWTRQVPGRLRAEESRE